MVAAACVFTSGRLFAQHDMPGMDMPRTPANGPAGLHDAKMGSGTSWLPDSSRARALTFSRGAWMLSLQGALFAQYDDQSTQRGDRQLGITDWEMLMAMRPAAGGLLHLSLMTSMEPFVLGGRGYPLLLQTGGSYARFPLHDRQHPHEALMELSAMYEHSIGSRVAGFMYAGLAGEPALGPVAFMHRPSAANDPLAPLGHHWQDAAHESFGVVTAGLNSRTLRLEGSLFNPREADEHHLVADFRGARLDSYAGRLSWAATPRVVAAAWWGYFNSHDRLDPDTRMHRYGASVLTEQRGPAGGRWSSTLVWAMNVHHHGPGAHELLHGNPNASPHHHSSSLLAESTLEIGRKNAVFARIEAVKKSGEELGFQGGDLTALYDIRSYVVGVSRQLIARRSLALGVGARGSLSWLPRSLELTYGTRRPTGAAIYLQIRPRAGAGAGAG